MPSIDDGDILSLPVGKLYQYLEQHFLLDIPISLDTPEDLKTASRLLSIATSNYAFLANLAVVMKIKKRMLRQEKAPKEQIDDAISKEDLINTYVEITKTYYSSVSRMVTIKQQINAEINMSGKVT